MFRLIACTCPLLGLLCVADVQAVQCQNNIPADNPDAVYQDHGDGTVTDTRTGLMWKKCSEGQIWSGGTCTGTATTWTWDNALSMTESLNYAGYSDWRLPNIKELRSLVEGCASNPAINVDVFPNTPSSYFWSGSPFAVNSGNAWYVDFNDGDAYYNGRDDGVHVRAVRGGQ